MNFKDILESLPPDGVYPGLQSGYDVEFTANGKKYKHKTKTGIRGLNISCSVHVKKNSVVDVDPTPMLPMQRREM